MLAIALGCSSSGNGNAPPRDAAAPVREASKAVDELAKIRDDACACRDAACADRAQTALEAWMATTENTKGNQADAERAGKIFSDFQACIVKATTPAAP